MIHEFQCENCNSVEEVLYKPSEEVDCLLECPKCDIGIMKLIVSAPRGRVVGSENPVKQ